MNKLTLGLLIAVAAALSACGKSESPPAPQPSAAVAPAPAAAAAPAADGDLALGKSVYNKTCALCHAAGTAGAPKPGDKADWGPRIAQGNELLYTHAIQGYTGSKGMMPAKGGNSGLSDAEVKAAVDYIASLSR